MKLQDFDQLVNDTLGELRDLLVVKGGEYAGSDDRLANFKRGAALVGVTPLQVLFIYLSKHYDAVATFVRDQATNTERPRSESIEGRLDDLMNYCLLAKALVREAAPVATMVRAVLNGEPARTCQDCKATTTAVLDGVGCVRCGHCFSPNVTRD